MAVADAGCRRDAQLDIIVVQLYSDAFAKLLEEHQGQAEELAAATCTRQDPRARCDR